MRLEVRDQITGIAVANVAMRNYVDYEIDYAEGRLLFRVPVNSVSESSTIISDDLLNGNSVFVVVDYEFRELSTSFDESTYGGRVKTAVSDQVSLGATYVKEERPTSTYDLVGGDISVRLGEKTRMTAEWSQSENEALPQFVFVPTAACRSRRNPSPPPATRRRPTASTSPRAAARSRPRATSATSTRDSRRPSPRARTTSTSTAGRSGSASAKSGQFNCCSTSGTAEASSTVRTGTLQYKHDIGKFGLTAEGRYRDTRTSLRRTPPKGSALFVSTSESHPR